MPYLIRRPTFDDVSRLAELLGDYVRETYDGAWAGTAEQLRRDGFGGEFEILLAETAQREIIGFAAVCKSYDLKFCLKGGEIIDLFVAREHRGQAAALLLIAAAAHEIRARGGSYLKGGAIDDARVRRLYARVGRNYGGSDYYVSARAFRHLADLHGKSARETIKNLPPVEWNDEP